MRNVLKNSSEVAHFWAHQVQASGRNAGESTRFDGPAFYSYRACVAIRFERPGKPPVAVFTKHKYSVTTSGHQNDAYRAFSGNGDIVYAPTSLHGQDTPEQMRAAWTAEIESKALVYRDQTRRPSKAKALRLLTYAVDEANLLCEAFDLPLFDEVPQDAEVEAYTQSISHVVFERRRLMREAEAAQDARDLADAQKRIEQWKAGEDVSSYGFYCFRKEIGDLLRVKYAEATLGEDGESPTAGEPIGVETSQSVTVPFKHVVRQAPLLMRLVRSGKTWATNGHTIHLGHFKVDRILEDGTLVAGCHMFKREELERFAKVIGVSGTESTETVEGGT